MANKPPAIGIKLGNTNSCVAVYQNGVVEIIPNDQGHLTTPMCVAFTEHECLIGESAKDQMAMNPKNTVCDIMRLIDRDFKAIQSYIKNFPFKVVYDAGKPVVEVEYQGKLKRISPVEILLMIITKMKDTAEAYLDARVTKAVLSVPVYFDDLQKETIIIEAKIAGLNVLHIISEPVAVALAYGFDRSKYDIHKVLVCDLGGGTFDVSLLEINDQELQVKSNVYDNQLGGNDFDSKMMDYFVAEIEHKKDISNNIRALQRIRTACEKTKCALSLSAQATIIIPALYDGIDFMSNITRVQFQKLSSDLFFKIIDKVERVITDAGVYKNEIDEIVLVGGSSRMPGIRAKLQEYFNGKEMNILINPEEAIAIGAAIKAAILTDIDPRQIDSLIKSQTPFSVSHKWILENYERLFSSENSMPTLSVVYSDTFPTSDELSFSLRLLPIYFDETDQNTYMSVFLYLKQCQLEYEAISVFYELSLINSKGKQIYIKNDVKIFKQENSYGWDKFIEVNYLLDQSNGFLQNGNLIILCEAKIFVNESNKLHRKLNYFTSENRFNCDLKVNQVNRLWEIDQFSSFFYRTNVSIEKYSCVQSKKFPEREENRNKYFLRLWPKGIDEQSDGFVSLFLHCEKLEQFNYAQYRLSILDRRGEFFHFGEGKLEFETEKNSKTQLGQGMTKFLPIDSIFDPENGLLPGDKFSIYCEIEEVHNNDFHKTDSLVLDSKELSKFKEILSNLIENNLFQIKLNNSDDQNYDFRSAPLENLNFSCNSKFEFSRIINCEKHLNISQSNRRKYFENLDSLIKSNFEQLIPVFRNCFQLRFIIKNWNYKLNNLNPEKFAIENINKPDILPQLNFATNLDKSAGQSKEEMNKENEKHEQDDEKLNEIQLKNIEDIKKLENIENKITEHKLTIDQTILTVNNIYYEHYLGNANFKDCLVNTKSNLHFGDISIKTKLIDCTELIEKLLTIMSNEIKLVLDKYEQIIAEIKSSQSNDVTLIDMVLRNQKLILENEEEMKTIQNQLNQMKQTKNVIQPEMKQTIDRVIFFLNRIKFEISKVVVNISTQIRQSIETRQKSLDLISVKLNSLSDHKILYTDPLIKYLESVPTTSISKKTEQSHIYELETAKSFPITNLSTENCSATNQYSNFMVDPLTLENDEQKLADNQTIDQMRADFEQKFTKLCDLIVELKSKLSSKFPDKVEKAKNSK